MSDPRRKVSAGDRLDISARAWNDVMAMVREWRMMKPTGDGLMPEEETSTRIRIYNNTASTVPRGGGVMLNGQSPVLTETGVRANSAFANQVSIIGIAPAAGYGWDTGSNAGLIFAVALEPIAAGRIGWAATTGLAWCYVTLNTSGDKFARLYSGSTTFSSTTTGPGDALIVYPTTGTGTKLCLCMLTPFAYPHYRSSPTVAYPGVVNTGLQQFAGRKGFESGLYVFDESSGGPDNGAGTTLKLTPDGFTMHGFQPSVTGWGWWMETSGSPVQLDFELRTNGAGPTLRAKDGDVAFAITDHEGTNRGATDEFGTDTLGMVFVGGLYTGGIATGYMATGTTIDGGTW